jgi:ABC-type multidrug transport system ATPase subunit
MDFALGAALIALPPQHQIPLALATAAWQAVQAARRRRRARRAAAAAAAPAQEVTLEWAQVSCTLQGKDGAQRALLTDLQGRAQSGRLLAICGPSGSGKTTLLNVLAGQLPANKRVRLRGRVAANGAPVPAPGVRAGFVAQEDLFFAQLTARETLLMAAELRMPAGTTPAARAAAVDSAVRRLGLAACVDTAVGDAKTRGLSGGEKKRLSIACELIARPQLIMADEPTSGLDAFAAQQAMQALKDLSRDGHTVVVSIHQVSAALCRSDHNVCVDAFGAARRVPASPPPLPPHPAPNRPPKTSPPAPLPPSLAAASTPCLTTCASSPRGASSTWAPPPRRSPTSPPWATPAPSTSIPQVRRAASYLGSS